MEYLITTRELADAVGVSESSIKRWADQGIVRATRTAGGHRRITLVEAIRFVRSLRLPLVRPEILHLPDVAAIGGAAAPEGGAAAQLFAYLHDGEEAKARGLLQSLYLSGASVAEIVDDVVAPAMARIGDLWRHGAAGILVEHLATEICLHAVGELMVLLPRATGGPLAVGGAPPGDPYALPTLAAAAVLTEEGFRAENLGPHTPFLALLDTLRELGPALVWVSMSAAPEQPERTRGEIVELARAMARIGAAVVVGGRQAQGLSLGREKNLAAIGTMGELAAFARGLAAVGAAAGGDARGVAKEKRGGRSPRAVSRVSKSTGEER